MTLNQKRRIEKIEQALKIKTGKMRPFPNERDGFIEVPEHMTLIDIVAMCGGMGEGRKQNETGRN